MKTDNTILSVAIGYEVAQLLNLKTDKAGKIKTGKGMLSIQQLGANIAAIIKEQEGRLSE